MVHIFLNRNIMSVCMLASSLVDKCGEVIGNITAGTA